MIESHLYQTKAALPPPVIAGEYKQKTSAAVNRTAHAAVAIDNKIYAFGGSHQILNSVMEVYDIETDQWANLATQGTPSPRHSIASCVLNGKLYIFGGSTTTAWSPTAEAYVFDPATNIWTKLANQPAALCIQTAVAIKGKIYLFGGFNGGSSVNSFYEYDPVSNTYRTIPNSQSVSHGHRAVNIADRMFVVGGVAGTPLLSRCVAYDPTANTWATYASSPLANTYTFTDTLGGYLYMFGGSRNTDTTTHNRLFRFHPPSNTWDELPTGAQAGYYGVMIPVEDRLYLHGGRNSTTLFPALWEIT